MEREMEKIDDTLKTFSERVHGKTHKERRKGVGGGPTNLLGQGPSAERLPQRVSGRSGCVMAADVQGVRKELRGVVCMPLHKN